MASVTFPAELGGSGATISDDTSPVTGLAAGGHRARFVPALQQTVAMAMTAKNKAQVAVDESASAYTSKIAAQEAQSHTEQSVAQAQAQVSEASNYSAQSAAQSAAAISAAAAANAALLAIGSAISNGLGAFLVDGNGELIVDYNDGSISNITMSADGEVIIHY